MGFIDVHHPLALVFGILGNVVSVGVYLAPIPTFISICKNKSTMGFQSLPYVVALFSSLLWLYYSLIKGGDTFLLITINAFGSLIESLYLIIFVMYATPYGKKQTFKISSAAMAMCLVIFLGSYFLLQGTTRAVVVGWICVGMSICVFASPLTIVVSTYRYILARQVMCVCISFNLKRFNYFMSFYTVCTLQQFKVVKTKSIEFMPFPLSCLLTLSAMTWFTYGMFTADLCVTVPNVLGFVLGVIQIALYQYYKQKSKVISIPEIKLPDHIINIRISNSEVYPVDSSRSSSSISSEMVEVEEKKQNKMPELYKGMMTTAAMVDDDPCGVEVVKPVLIMCAA
ncbi:hypothetical protein R6Q59_033373 [Mikania micrantha]